MEQYYKPRRKEQQGNQYICIFSYKGIVISRNSDDLEKLKRKVANFSEVDFFYPFYEVSGSFVSNLIKLVHRKPKRLRRALETIVRDCNVILIDPVEIEPEN